MTAPDRVNATLTAQDIADLNAAATTLETKLAFRIGLSPEERQAIPKMGVSGNDFVRDVLIAAEQNPALIPAVIDIAGARRDYNLVNDLTPIVARLQNLLEGLNDTLLEAGSEAFVTSLEAYDILKRLGKGTALDESLKKMSRRFARQPRQPKPPVEGTPSA